MTLTRSGCPGPAGDWRGQVAVQKEIDSWCSGGNMLTEAALGTWHRRAFSLEQEARGREEEVGRESRVERSGMAWRRAAEKAWPCFRNGQAAAQREMPRDLSVLLFEVSQQPSAAVSRFPLLQRTRTTTSASFHRSIAQEHLSARLTSRLT